MVAVDGLSFPFDPGLEGFDHDGCGVVLTLFTISHEILLSFWCVS
jgi:hypothetical protein